MALRPVIATGIAITNANIQAAIVHVSMGGQATIARLSSVHTAKHMAITVHATKVGREHIATTSSVHTALRMAVTAPVGMVGQEHIVQISSVTMEGFHTTTTPSIIVYAMRSTSATTAKVGMRLIWN